MMDPDDQWELIGPLSLVIFQCGKDRQPRTSPLGETHGGGGQKTFYGATRSAPAGRGTPPNHSPSSRRHRKSPSRANVKPPPLLLGAEAVHSHRNPPTGHSHRHLPSGTHKPRTGRSTNPNNTSMSSKKHHQIKKSPEALMPQTDPTQKESGKSVKEREQQQPTLLISATAGTVRESPTQRATQTTQMMTATVSPAQPADALKEVPSVAGAPPKSKAAEPAKPPSQISDTKSPVVIVPETTHAPAPRRDLKRDRSLALKALVNYKEKHEISERSKRKRDEEKSARQKEQNSEPEIRNQEEKGVMLEEEADGGGPHEKEEDFDNPNDGGPGIVIPPPQLPPPQPLAKSPIGPSASFPTVDTPDIPPAEVGGVKPKPDIPPAEAGGVKPKPVERISDKADSSDSEGASDKEQSEKQTEKPPEKQPEKKIMAQGTIFTPDDQRQFKPISDIPADDLTVKRETKKKKKKKRKSKKRKKAKSGKRQKPNKANKDEPSR